MTRASPVLLLLLAGCPNRSPPPPPSSPPEVTEEQARQRRQACEFRAGALPAETLHTHAARGGDIPVDHILLVMQENRSFDHYFSRLSHGGVRVAPDDAVNPDALGNDVARFHETRYCVEDAPHSWSASHRQWSQGTNEGFVKAAGTDGARAMGYYDETDLPFYYALARNFAISDMHFASLLGPTWPNRMFYLAGTSWGLTSNIPPPLRDAEGRYHGNLFFQLTDARVDWKVYSEAVPSPLMFVTVYEEARHRFVKMDQFYADAAAGTLPQVALVESNFGTDSSAIRNDEHAPANVQVGQAWTEGVARALMASPNWGRSVLFITYDEHGGFYDHVPPPRACAPDGYLASTDGGVTEGSFEQLGFRVPLLAISPYARRGHVSHHVSDLTGVIRFIQTRFNLPALTARDANAEPLLDLFDFQHPDTRIPELPAAEVDPVELQRCEQLFPRR
ncbi:MAG: alkaline phosphatase family protein [Myxococcota bacterium]